MTPTRRGLVQVAPALLMLALAACGPEPLPAPVADQGVTPPHDMSDAQDMLALTDLSDARDMPPDADLSAPDLGPPGEPCPRANRVRCQDGVVSRCYRQQGVLVWNVEEVCEAGFCDARLAACAPCQNTCEQLGQVVCQEGATRTCQMDPAGCRVWGPWSQCEVGVCADDGMRCATCRDACGVAGDLWCRDGEIRACRLGESGCLEWGPPDACPSLLCADPTRCSDCVNTCGLPGEVFCDVGMVSRCEQDARGCLRFDAPRPCTTGACEDATTCQPCVDACPQHGATRCVGGVTETCAVRGVACLEWGAPAACASGVCAPDSTRCGECAEVCAVGTTRCVGGVAQVCEADATGCPTWGVDVSCGSGACDGAWCAACSPACPGPESFCTGDVRSSCRWAGPGCWTQDVIACAQGCEAGACQGRGCALPDPGALVVALGASGPGALTVDGAGEVWRTVADPGRGRAAALERLDALTGVRLGTFAAPHAEITRALSVSGGVAVGRRLRHLDVWQLGASGQAAWAAEALVAGPGRPVISAMGRAGDEVLVALGGEVEGWSVAAPASPVRLRRWGAGVVRVDALAVRQDRGEQVLVGAGAALLVRDRFSGALVGQLTARDAAGQPVRVFERLLVEGGQVFGAGADGVARVALGDGRAPALVRLSVRPGAQYAALALQGDALVLSRQAPPMLEVWGARDAAAQWGPRHEVPAPAGDALALAGGRAVVTGFGQQAVVLRWAQPAQAGAALVAGLPVEAVRADERVIWTDAQALHVHAPDGAVWTLPTPVREVAVRGQQVAGITVSGLTLWALPADRAPVRVASWPRQALPVRVAWAGARLAVVWEAPDTSQHVEVWALDDPQRPAITATFALAPGDAALAIHGRADRLLLGTRASVLSMALSATGAITQTTTLATRPAHAMRLDAEGDTVWIAAREAQHDTLTRVDTSTPTPTTLGVHTLDLWPLARQHATWWGVAGERALIAWTFPTSGGPPTLSSVRAIAPAPVRALAAQGPDLLIAHDAGLSRLRACPDADPWRGLILDAVLLRADVGALDDQRQWVTVHNPTAAPIDLSGYALGWSGPQHPDYTAGRLQLSGTLAPGDRATFGGPVSDLTNASPALSVAADLSPDLAWNTATAEGVALFRLPASTPITPAAVPIDALVHGVANTRGLLAPDGLPAPVHSATPGQGVVLVRTRQGWGP